MERRIVFTITCFTVSLLMRQALCQICEHQWLSYNEDICFRYFEERIPHSATKQRCASQGARIISALSPRLKDFLLKNSKQHEDTSYWCSTLTEEEIHHAVLQSSTVSNAATSSRTPGTPSAEADHKTNCYYIQHKAIHEGPCDELRGYICEKDSLPFPGTCRQGRDKIGSSCFWKISKLLNRNKAAEACATKGGFLANLSSKRKTIYGIGTVMLERNDFWIGAKRQGETVKWDNGETLHLGEDEKFISTEDDGGGCVRLGLSDVSESGTVWITGNCSVAAYGLCEQAALLTTPMTTSTTTILSLELTRQNSCPGTTKESEDGSSVCFWHTLHLTDRFDWETARKYCQSYGGDLASYKSAAEEEVKHWTRNWDDLGEWIGLRRKHGSNVFKWSDGSPLTYTNWAPGEPKIEGNRLCVAQRGSPSTWKVHNCVIRQWFVCKLIQANIPASPVVPTNEPIEFCIKPDAPPDMTCGFYQGYCYCFTGKKKFSWTSAKTYCQDNGAFLASVHSLEELEFLRHAAPDRSDLGVFWIGLRAKGLDSSYQWDDGTPIDFVNWNDNSIYDDESNIDNCVSFRIVAGTWKKENCDRLNHVICKYKNGTDNVFPTAAPTLSLPGFCPDEWYTHGNKCYKTFGSEYRDTWPNANRKCQEIGSSLVSIHSSEEQDFLSLLLQNIRISAWIGMYSTVGGRLFHWTDNSSVDYTNWDVSEPNFNNYQEECAHMVYSPYGNLGKWNDHQCQMRYAFICQNPKDPMLLRPGVDAFMCTKPKGWLKLGSSCYKIFNESGFRLTWIQAQSYCLSVLGNLASVDNSGISVLLRHHLAGIKGSFWIGMRDMKMNTYAWLGNRPLKYTNWLKSQPKAVSDINNCVAMNSDGKWMVRACYDSLPFICEERKEAPTVAPHEPEMLCPNSSQEWQDFGGKFCYIIEIKHMTSWTDAAHICFKKGGYLASFHSVDELKVIKHYIQDVHFPVHIGLGQKEDGSFAWMDGSALDFVNWAPGEPSDSKEMCVEMYSEEGTWNDVSCYERRGYVCSTKKVPKSEGSESASKNTDERKDLHGRIAAGGVVGIIICILVVLVIGGLICYYFCPSTRMRARRVSEPSSP